MIQGNPDRWNFRVLLWQGVFNEVGETLSSERLVLPYLYAIMGGPALIAGLLMPVVTVAKIGSQIIAAPIIEAAEHGKWYVAISIAFSAMVLAVIATIATDIPPLWLAVAFLSAAIIIGLGNGIGSVSFQDMLGHVLSAEYRGDLLFAIAAVAGLVAVVAALVSYFASRGGAGSEPQFHLVWAGIALLLVAAVVTAAVREAPRMLPPVLTAERQAMARKGLVSDFFGSARLVWNISWFRRFVVARLLFLSIELAMPFFAVHAAKFHAATAVNLSMLVVAASVGMVLGGIVWPPVARRSIKLVMAASAMIAFVAALISLSVNLDPILDTKMTHVIAFTLLSFAMQGVLNARTLYVVGVSSDEERPYAIAIGNIVCGIAGIGFALLIGLIAHARGTELGLVGMAAMNILTVFFVWTLADVPHRATAEHKPAKA